MGIHTADGFNCNCSVCKKFDKKLTVTPGVSTDLRLSPRCHKTTRHTAGTVVHSHQYCKEFPPKGNSKQWIKIGDRVTVHDQIKGIVKFVGPLDADLMTPDIYVGIKLDEHTGLHSGIVDGKRYFEAPLGCGLMVKYDEVQRVKPADRRPPVYGNYMYPSYKSQKTYSESTQNTKNKYNDEKSPSHTASRMPKPAKQSNRQPTKEYKHIISSKEKVPADPLPRRLRRETSTWKQETNIKQADIMKSTLTKLYLAKEKGKKEMQDERRVQELEDERKRLTAMKKENTRTIYRESSWKMSETL